MRYVVCLTSGLTCFGVGGVALLTGNDLLQILLFPWMMILGLFLLLCRNPETSGFE